MTRFSWALLGVAVCLASAAPAVAQVVGRPIEVSGRYGVFTPDARARMEQSPAFGATVGWRYHPWLTFEMQALLAPSKADSSIAKHHNFTYAGLDLRWNLVPPENVVVPFLLSGVGYGLSHTSESPPDKLERGAGSVGAGALWNIVNQRTYIRLEARNTWFRERGLREFSNHTSIQIGLQYNFGGREKDTDFDGVRDWLDKCPDTPLGATVDANGCPIDSDGDGVWDGLDQCEGTIAGCVVDSTGCDVDSDGDGVCDGLDQCADTPAGAAVDANGCPSDSDGDGVLDGLDQCPNTPSGCTVDPQGCSQDSDGDGVCDGLDQCPNTPDSLAVNAAGCPYELGAMEMRLLQTGRVRLDDVGFATARGDLEEHIFPILTELGQILLQYPDLQIELAGFTDDRGDTAAAYRMSRARANAVLTWFRRNMRELDADRFEVRGYGPAGSGTQARYVELRVTNPDLLPAELLKRTPPDTTGTGGAGAGGSDATQEESSSAPDTTGTGGSAPDTTQPGAGGSPPDTSGTGGAAPDTTAAPGSGSSSESDSSGAPGGSPGR